MGNFRHLKSSAYVRTFLVHWERHTSGIGPHPDARSRATHSGTSPSPKPPLRRESESRCEVADPGGFDLKKWTELETSSDSRDMTR